MNPPPKKRLWLFVAALLVAFAAAGFRLVDLQVLRHADLLALAQENTQRTFLRQAPRGEIRDIRGNLLAASKLVKTVCADPALICNTNIGNRQPEVAALLAPLLDITPEELIAKALTSFAEIRNQMNITAGQIAKERGLPDPDYRAVIRKLKEEQIPADKVMPLYRERLAAIEDAVRQHHIVSLPSRAASIRLASPAENAQQPAPHMSPPRLIGNTGEYGEFVLTTGMPPDASGKQLRFDDFSHQAATWTLTSHEARPGHELQFAKMIEAGVSTARAVFAFNSVNVEGWALYAEAEMQPYEPLDGQLFALQARAQRAARAFLDPMVNLGQIEPEDVKSFLMTEVGLSEGMATQEMQRYVFRAPGQATSYFYGYQRLMETRQAAQLALRGNFDRQAFNDFVLAQGLLPPRLLRKAVMDEFVPAHRPH